MPRATLRPVGTSDRGLRQVPPALGEMPQPARQCGPKKQAVG